MGDGGDHQQQQQPQVGSEPMEMTFLDRSGNHLRPTMMLTCQAGPSLDITVCHHIPLLMSELPTISPAVTHTLDDPP